MLENCFSVVEQRLRTKQGARRSPSFSCLLIFLAALSGIICFRIPCFAQDARTIHVVAADQETGKWEEIPLYRNTYAAIIGIDRYPNLPADRQLSYAVSDAKAVERMLQDKYVFTRIYTLYNEQATRVGIMDLFLKELTKLGENDALFVFFAGHAGQEKTAFGDVGFLVTYDGGFKDSSNNISMTTLRDDISKRIPSKHVFYVMDCCYSGLLLATRDAGSAKPRRSIAYLRQIAKEPVRQVLCAGDANQTVLDGGPRGHSVFTGRFLEALDEADDFITASEISALVKERVFSDAQARNHAQTPKDGEFFGLGDFVFMPSSAKRQESVSQQVSALETEVARYNKMEEDAGKAKDEAARREAERMRQAAEAKLKAKQQEQERIQADADRQAREAEERKKKEDEQKRQQAEEETRLATLKTEVEAKRSKIQDLATASWSEAVSEMRSLDKQIRDLRAQHLEEVRKRILTIARAESGKEIRTEKDEFETREEYEARLEKMLAHDDVRGRFREAQETVQASYDNLAKPLLDQMAAIARKTYRMVGAESVKVELGEYKAEKEGFAVTIQSAARHPSPLATGEHYMRITECIAGGQAAGVGLKPGDVFLAYDGKTMHTDRDLESAKSQVQSPTVEMKVLRGNEILSFHPRKGQIGINTEDFVAQDRKLAVDEFVARGYLRVPRTEARQFKQNSLNSFVHGEVTVCVPTPERTLVLQAFLVDDSNDKRYDLFAERFVNCGNHMTWDGKSNIFWGERTDLKLSQRGAELALQQNHPDGFGDWRLPTIQELLDARASLSGFHRGGWGEYYHTSASGAKAGTNRQLRMDNGEVLEENRSGRQYYCGVLPFRRDAPECDAARFSCYGMFLERFLDLANNMKYDARNHMIWQCASQKEKAFWDAVVFAQRTELEGIKGWVLPSVEELSSLYDWARPGLYLGFQLQTGWGTEHHTRNKTGPGKNYQYRIGDWEKYDQSVNDQRPFVCVF